MPTHTTGPRMFLFPTICFHFTVESVNLWIWEIGEVRDKARTTDSVPTLNMPRGGNKDECQRGTGAVYFTVRLR